MDELSLECKVDGADTLYVTCDQEGLIAFATTGDSVVVLSVENVHKLIKWLQERLER